MRRWITKLIVLFITLLFSAAALIAGTLAWETEQQALNTIREEEATTIVTLRKLEKTTEGVATDKVIPGASFELYKKDGTLLGGPFETDPNGQIKVKLPPGEYYFLETKSADGFTFDCDADGKSIKKYSFTVRATDTELLVEAFNRPDNKEKVEITGEKTWDLKGWNISLPRSITVYLMDGSTQVDKQTVMPSASGYWLYSFNAPKYRADGKEIAYTVLEEPVDGFYATYSGYDIKNTYIAPLEVELPTITKAVEGKNATREKFYFVLKGETGSPMPDGTSGRTWKVSRTGKGSVDLGSITFTEPGDYVYTVYELEGDDYNWEYDDSEYTVTIHIRRSGSQLSSSYTIKKGNRSASKITFTNTYEKIDLDKKVTISGQKTWYHMDNPQANWPDHIVVEIYADGTRVQQRRVSEADDWEYSFVLPKYNQFTGKEIDYEVDELVVEDYSKKIRGYDLINTYVGVPDNPDDPDDPADPDDPVDPSDPMDQDDPTPPVDPDDPDKPGKPDRPAKTGEEFDLSFWIAVMVFGASGFLLMILKIMYPPYEGKRVIKKGKRLK